MRAVTVSAAALVMSILLLGLTLTFVDLADLRTSLLDARRRMALLSATSRAYQLSASAAILSSVDSYALSLHVVDAGEAEKSLTEVALAALDLLDFRSKATVSVRWRELSLRVGPDGSTVVDFSVTYEVTDQDGDVLRLASHIVVSHPVRALLLGSLVNARHSYVVESLLAMGASSLQDLSSFNETYEDPRTGARVVTQLFAREAGLVTCVTSSIDSGASVLGAGRYEYVVRAESTLKFAWRQ